MSALQFISRGKAPRIGVTAEDPDLWEFSGGIQTPSGNVWRLQWEVDNFYEPFLSILQRQLVNFCEKFTKEFPWIPSFVLQKPKSIENLTSLFYPTPDLLLVLNTADPFRIVRGPDGSFQFSHQGHQLYPAVVRLIAGACIVAVDDFIKSQVEPTFTIKLLQVDGKMVFSIANTVACVDDIHLEFTITPALMTTANTIFFLNHENGTLVQSNQDLISRRFERYMDAFKGLREMTQVLKLVLKAGAKQFPKLLELPPVAFEVAMLELVQDRTKDTDAWWKKSSFAVIFRAAMSFLFDRLNADLPLPSLYDPKSDLLRNCRQPESHRELVLAFLDAWRLVPDQKLLSELQARYIFLTAESSVPVARSAPAGLPNSALPPSPAPSPAPAPAPAPAPVPEAVVPLSNSALAPVPVQDDAPTPTPTSSDTDCCICLDAPATHAIIPCGHRRFCGGCIKNLETCSICREPVKSILRIY